MHQQVKHSRILHSAHSVFMCFIFISEQTAALWCTGLSEVQGYLPGLSDVSFYQYFKRPETRLVIYTLSIGFISLRVKLPVSASTNTRDYVEPMKYAFHVFCTSVSAERKFVFNFNQRIRLQKTYHAENRFSLARQVQC
jgi:hypothetical protein